MISSQHKCVYKEKDVYKEKLSEFFSPKGFQIVKSSSSKQLVGQLSPLSWGA
jgi:hypothetical protein